MMTFNVLEYAGSSSCRSCSRRARGVRRRPPLRGVRRGGRRLRLHGEPVLGLEDRERGVHLLLRPLLRPPVPRLPLLERLRPLRQRPAPDVARAAALHPRDVARRADHGLRRPGEGARLHVHRRLRRRDRRAASRRSRGPRRQRDDQSRLRPGQHARPRRGADRRGARRRAADDDRAVAARRGDALRRRHPQGARPARLGPAGARSTRASPARSPGSRSIAPRTRRRTCP